MWMKEWSVEEVALDDRKDLAVGIWIEKVGRGSGINGRFPGFCA